MHSSVSRLIHRVSTRRRPGSSHRQAVGTARPRGWEVTGTNFLVDNIRRKIMDLLGTRRGRSSGDWLEKALTGTLRVRATATLVELDEILAANLQERFADTLMYA